MVISSTYITIISTSNNKDSLRMGAILSRPNRRTIQQASVFQTSSPEPSRKNPREIRDPIVTFQGFHEIVPLRRLVRIPKK